MLALAGDDRVLNKGIRYPEVLAGGYSRVDGQVAFSTRVHQLLCELEATAESLTIVDFGAGRGVRAESTSGVHRRLQDLRGPNRRVVGLDVDEAVEQNPLLDEAIVIDPAGRLPLEDGTVDLLVSEWVWEHLADPGHVASELKRVVRPGGWVCAYTPNKWGYIGIGARLVPNQRHHDVLTRLQEHKKPEDTFPTRYRLNTSRAFKRWFPAEDWELAAYTHDAEPMLYAGNSRVLGAALRIAHHLPGPLRSTWFVFLRRRGDRA